MGDDKGYEKFIETLGKLQKTLTEGNYPEIVKEMKEYLSAQEIDETNYSKIAVEISNMIKKYSDKNQELTKDTDLNKYLVDLKSYISEEKLTSEKQEAFPYPLPEPQDVPLPEKSTSKESEPPSSQEYKGDKEKPKKPTKTVTDEVYLQKFNEKTGLNIPDIPQLCTYIIKSGNISQEHIKYLLKPKKLGLEGEPEKETHKKVYDSLKKYYQTKYPEKKGSKNWETPPYSCEGIDPVMVDIILGEVPIDPKRWDVEIYKLYCDRLRETIEQLKEETNRANSLNDSLRTEISNKNKQIGELTKTNKQLQTENTEYRDQIGELTKTNKQLQTENTKYIEQIGELTKTNKQLQGENTKYIGQIDELNKKIEYIQKITDLVLQGQFIVPYLLNKAALDGTLPEKIDKLSKDINSYLGKVLPICLTDESQILRKVKFKLKLLKGVIQNDRSSNTI